MPDETGRGPLLTYPNARPGDWPQADGVAGHPPFLGTSRMREDLGDGDAETLRAAYPEVPESADFVMDWEHKAAALLRSGAVRRLGLITPHSLRQIFNRRVVEAHLKGTISALGAIARQKGGVPIPGGGARIIENPAPIVKGGVPTADISAPIPNGGAPIADIPAPIADTSAPILKGGGPKWAIYSGEGQKATPNPFA